MIIYLDESGNLGFDFTKSGTSRYIVMTALVCDDTQTARKIAQAIKRTIKHKLPSSSREFKGVNTAIKIKRYFLSHIIDIPSWRLYSIVADKFTWKDYHETAKSKSDLFYNQVAKKLLMQIEYPSGLDNLSLIVDRSKNEAATHDFNHTIKLALKPLISRNTIFSIEHKSSHQNHGLQAVDLFCWGVSRYWDKNIEEWYADFKDRLVTEIVFRPPIKKDSP